MDLATLLGLIGSLAVVVIAVSLGSSTEVFINIPSLVIVVGGTLTIVMMKFSLKQSLGALKIALRAFVVKIDEPENVIKQIIQLAVVAQKEGLLALDNQEVDDDFLNQGISMLVDGADRTVISTLLSKDFQQTQNRHAWGIKIFTAMGDVAPAMGMIGTLIGLVNMLSTMEDPSTIGPAMAVALLTTLYGAIIANIIALPIADKLKLRKADEGRNMAICIDGVLAINDKQNPRIIESMLETYVAPQQRNQGDLNEPEAA